MNRPTAEAGALEKRPGTHAGQRVLPTELDALPAGQLRQELASARTPYSPRLQAVQERAVSREKVPGAQTLQAVRPWKSAKRPGEHERHPDAPARNSDA